MSRPYWSWTSTSTESLLSLRPHPRLVSPSSCLQVFERMRVMDLNNSQQPWVVICNNKSFLFGKNIRLLGMYLHNLCRNNSLRVHITFCRPGLHCIDGQRIDVRILAEQEARGVPSKKPVPDYFLWNLLHSNLFLQVFEMYWVILAHHLGRPM